MIDFADIDRSIHRSIDGAEDSFSSSFVRRSHVAVGPLDCMYVSGYVKNTLQFIHKRALVLTGVEVTNVTVLVYT